MPTALEKVGRLKTELDSVRPLNAEAEKRVMQKFRLDWNYHSNHLEGTQLTYGETKALLLFGITAQGKPLKDHLEITGHNEAIELVNDVVKDGNALTEVIIRQLHTLLLKAPYQVDAVTPDGQPTKRLVEIGKYKSHPNHVLTQTGATFYFATPEETPAKMTDLIEWYRQKKDEKDVNPIKLAAEFHYKFIRIHPFDDGNGRLARILMNFILMQFGYPPVIIKTEDKNNYFSVLQQADAGIFEPFVEYIATNLQHSLEIMIKGAKGENIEEPEDFDKELALLEQKLKIASSNFPVEVTRSKEALQILFDDFLHHTIEVFYKTAKKFDRFYKNTDFSIEIDDDEKGIIFASTDDFCSIKDTLQDSSTGLGMRYAYNTLKAFKFADIKYSSNIKFQFNSLDYSVRVSSPDFQQEIQKSYLEPNMENELEPLINKLSQAHKEYIEQQVQTMYENPL